jgi:hypothetical protein
MFDNDERVYVRCCCGQHTVLIKNWHGPCPNGCVLCSRCGSQLPFITFRHAFTGARWSDRFYARLRG